MNKKLLIKTLHGHTTDQTSVWLIGQSGRYLPEYVELRNKAGSFLDLCLTPKMAAEIALQPIKRFNVDAAALFSTILMVPHALGQKIEFFDNKFPVLDRIENNSNLTELSFDIKKVEPVFEALEITKSNLPSNKAMIGFCGGLWTITCYMVEGLCQGEFEKVLSLTENQPDFINNIMAVVYEVSFEYLCKQIEAGAEVIQIFDNLAGLLQAEKFRKLVIEPTKLLVQALEKKYPEILVMGYPKGATPADYKAYIVETGVDALGVDKNIPLDFIKNELQSEKPVQGNLDPRILVAGGDKLITSVNNIMENLGTNHIFNLEHRVLPDTPPENVSLLVKQIKEFVVDE